MTSLSLERCVFPVCFTVLLLFAGGCDEGTGVGQEVRSLPAAADRTPGEGGPASRGIKQIMGKLAKGPKSLTPVIGNALSQNPPPWETIQGQTKEFSRLASEMGKYNPPKGAKQSWIKLTTAYAKSATELDRAAAAKDKDAAKVAHDQLKNSCNACHQQHR
jgi:cytochrome c556